MSVATVWDSEREVALTPFRRNLQVEVRWTERGNRLLGLRSFRGAYTRERQWRWLSQGCEVGLWLFVIQLRWTYEWRYLG